MPKGYWIVRVSVNKPDIYPQYIEAGAAAFKKFNANFLVRGGAYSEMEGRARERNVVIEFESVDVATACYNSPEYQAALKIRNSCSEADMIIIEGA